MSVCVGVFLGAPVWAWCFPWAAWAASAPRSWTCGTTTATSCTTSSTRPWRSWPCSPSCCCPRARGSRCLRRWATGSSTGAPHWAGGGGTTCRCWPPQTQRPKRKPPQRRHANRSPSFVFVHRTRERRSNMETNRRTNGDEKGCNGLYAS